MLARGLLEYETLTGDEIIALLKGIPPVRTPYEEPALPGRGEGTVVPAAGKPRRAGPGPIITPSRSRGSNDRYDLIKGRLRAALFFCLDWLLTRPA